jgi:hypothetical protein
MTGGSSGSSNTSLTSERVSDSQDTQDSTLSVAWGGRPGGEAVTSCHGYGFALARR